VRTIAANALVPALRERFHGHTGASGGSLQDSPARWVMVHRMHHQHSDKQPDPHSPLVNWFWGHVGWLPGREPSADQVLDL
jgi:fatty-acid desaturase